MKMRSRIQHVQVWISRAVNCLQRHHWPRTLIPLHSWEGKFKSYWLTESLFSRLSFFFQAFHTLIGLPRFILLSSTFQIKMADSSKCILRSESLLYSSILCIDFIQDFGPIWPFLNKFHRPFWTNFLIFWHWSKRSGSQIGPQQYLQKHVKVNVLG